MGVIEVDGAQLNYQVEGHGERTLAFAHGWCSMLSHWDAQAAHFRADHRVVRWDRRGMGRSSAPQPADAPARHADDLAAILDAHGITRVTMVGHAGGGPSALAFADRYPARTDGLVLVDARLHAPPGPDEADDFASIVDQMCDAIAGDGGPANFEAIYRSFFGPRTAPATVAAAVANALATPREVAVAELRHALGDTMHLATRIRCPVLWVSARPDDTALVRRLFGDVMIGHVVGSGHFVQLEVADQLNAMMDAFLAARRPSERAAR